MKLGIDRYNEECRAIVMTYAKEWERTVNRIGYGEFITENISTGFVSIGLFLFLII